jgi:hypothetical protein
MTLTPDDVFEGSGEYDGIPRTWGSADPSCENPGTADLTAPWDTLSQLQATYFCFGPGPGTPYLIQGIADSGGSVDADSYHYWEHHCSFGGEISGENRPYVLGVAMAAKPGCPFTGVFKKEDCYQQLENIADKCAAKDNHNLKIGGDTYDQKCLG